MHWITTKTKWLPHFERISRRTLKSKSNQTSIIAGAAAVSWLEATKGRNVMTKLLYFYTKHVVQIGIFRFSISSFIACFVGHVWWIFV